MARRCPRPPGTSLSPTMVLPIACASFLDDGRVISTTPTLREQRSFALV
jgi:hypothetical protein